MLFFYVDFLVSFNVSDIKSFQCFLSSITETSSAQVDEASWKFLESQVVIK